MKLLPMFEFHTALTLPLPCLRELDVLYPSSNPQEEAE